MKIGRIKLKNFRQFKSLDLDLTYPKGHTKEGKPLDKVCFIGQSGTGKTTLLDLVNDFSMAFSKVRGGSRLRNTYFQSNIKQEGRIEVFLWNSKDSKKIRITSEDPEFTSKGLNFLKGEKTDAAWCSNDIEQVLYFPTGIASIDDTIDEESYFTKDRERGKYLFLDNKGASKIWNFFFSKIKQRQTDEANFRIQLTKRAEKEDISIRKELKSWKEDHPNPLEKIATECLNPILEKLNLCVSTDITTIGQSNSIQIKSLANEEIIPYEALSTGTRQLIYTAFPIYLLMKENTFVLMDEPETSLYPDLQREIIPYYTSFDKSNGEKCQFFFATHSPIIASSFEPWEIVELKFDQSGNIYRELYYEGENHVDNYFIDPRYLKRTKIDQFPTAFEMCKQQIAVANDVN